jgi:hypothetical protein
LFSVLSPVWLIKCVYISKSDGSVYIPTVEKLEKCATLIASVSGQDIRSSLKARDQIIVKLSYTNIVQLYNIYINQSKYAQTILVSDWLIS